MTKLKITILGCGTSVGVPTIGCDCKVCQSSNSKNKRLRSSILITKIDTGEHCVVDTTPDFRMQMLTAGVKDLHDVLYTHTHADHCHGFDDLRVFYFKEKKAVRCWGSETHLSELKDRFSYAFKDTGYSGIRPQIELKEFRKNEVFKVLGLEVEPIFLPHGNMRTTAFRVGSFAYATDFKLFTPEAIKMWKGKVKTMIASGLHYKEHYSHSSIPETLDLFNKLEVERGVLTHLSHLVDYTEVSAKLPDHVSLAYDGMSFQVEM